MSSHPFILQLGFGWHLLLALNVMQKQKKIPSKKSKSCKSSGSRGRTSEKSSWFNSRSCGMSVISLAISSGSSSVLSSGVEGLLRYKEGSQMVWWRTRSSADHPAVMKQSVSLFKCFKQFPQYSLNPWREKRNLYGYTRILPLENAFDRREAISLFFFPIACTLGWHQSRKPAKLKIDTKKTTAYICVRDCNTVSHSYH